MSRTDNSQENHKHTTKDNQQLRAWVVYIYVQADRLLKQYRQKAIGLNPRRVLHVFYHEVHEISAYILRKLLDQQQLNH